MSTYTGVTNCQKQSGFFWPTLYINTPIQQQMSQAPASSGESINLGAQEL